jgi:hypothetical protein
MNGTIRTLTRSAALAGALSLIFLAGCESKSDKALDKAKAQAAATNTAQQIQYVDKSGNTITTTVQPAAAGQPQQIATTTTPPPAGTPVPHSTDPVITPVNSSGQPTGPTTTTSGAPAPAPVPVNITVPAGTELTIRIDQHIDVKHSRSGDRFSGEVVEPVSSNGTVIIPRNSPVSGIIDESHRRGHFKGRSVLELRLTSLTLNGMEYPLDTHDDIRSKRGKGRRSAGIITGMTGAGMVIGGVATGGVGLLVGGAIGAGAGTAIAGTTGNRDINIPAESVMHFRLADDLVVQNP